MRKPRLQFVGALHHVIARGDQGDPIFKDPGDRVRYLKTLGHALPQESFHLYAYCLMTNHVHLLVRQAAQDPLSQAMHRLQSAYTSFFNRKHRIHGHVFQGRYKAILVDGDTYLLTLARYIHLNPYRAGLEERIGRYPWTSYSQYLGKDKHALAPVETGPVLRMMGGNTGESRRRFRGFLTEGKNEGYRKDLHELRGGRILGDSSFEEKAYQEAGTGEIPVFRLAQTPIELWRSLLAREGLTSEPKGRLAVRLRGEAAYWLVTAGLRTQKEIAEIFEVDPATISRDIRRQSDQWKKDEPARKRNELWVKSLGSTKGSGVQLAVSSP